MSDQTTEPGGGGGGGGGIGGSLAGLGSGGDFLGQLQANVMRGDVGLALGVLGVLMIMLLPLPAFLLDLFLAVSMTFAVLILMTVLFIQKPLEFTSFPAILLITTMLRLALNIASTRLILSEGHSGTDAAGQLIQAFGALVMGGNYVIGVILFAILVLVNFIVITKGSGRIAEVAARFSLDAMPGKQMAIDADLSSGLITEKDARVRRRELEEESAFFGAMDGAAKFVRGDAIAGLLITFINVIGGMIIGMIQRDLSFAEAAGSYTLLTVGDGLVSQIPALVISVAAGMLVSKAGVTGAADKVLFGQLSAYPQALGIAAILLLLMATVPGIPIIPFVLMGSICGGLAYYIPRERAALKAQEAAKAAAEAAAPPPVAEEPISAALTMDHLRLELGYGLLSLVPAGDGFGLADQIRGLRRQMALEMGFILPSVRIQDNLQLPANTYVIRIKEVEAGRGDVRPNMLLCMDPAGQPIPLPGEQTTEPTFGLPAMWVPQTHREEAHFRGLTVVEPATVVTTHLTELVKDNMSELLSYTETQKLLDELDPSFQRLVADVVPVQISVGGLQRVLQGLLAERVSIRDLPTILEAVAEATGATRNIGLIVEHVRSRLARQLCDANVNMQGQVPLITLSPEWEHAFADSIIGDGDDRQLSMAPSQLQQFIQSVRQVFERQAMLGESPVLLTSPQIRPYVRSIVERFRPQTVVMSQNEIHPKARIKTLGQI